MKKYFSKVLCVLVILNIIITLVSTTFAVDTSRTTGTLKITKYETGKTDEDGNNLPLAGVKFQIYQVSEDYSFTTIPDDASVYKEAVTGTDGTVYFENLPLGRYLVIEAEAPENVTEKSANFLVDIPMTNETGDELIYDVEVKPKNNTVYGGVTINKMDESGNPLQNVTFKLEEKKNGSWNERKILDSEGNQKTLATDEYGMIVVEGLPQGEYRLVETSTLPGYILDNKTTYEFEVSMDQETTKTITSPDTFDIVNEQLEITKEVTNAENSDNSFDKTEEVDFEVVTEIPKAIADLEIYEIIDTLPEGLDYKEDSITIMGIDDEETEKPISKSNYTVLVEEGKITIDFNDNSLLSKYENLKIDYTTIFNGKESYVLENENIVELRYSSQILDATSDDVIIKQASASVYTGGFYIKKFEKGDESKLLGGAQFKIALTEEDAKNGNFIKIDDEDIILTTDEETGLASYGGLKYGTYYLVEVQAPTYVVDEEEKSYRLLMNPVEIIVNENTYKEENANKIANVKKTFLPSAGGIGTPIFYVVGVTLIVVSAILIKKKKN